MNRLLSLLLLAAMAAFPQTTPKKKAPAKSAPAVKPPEQPDKYPVGTLKVEGNANYTPAQVLGVAGLKVGDLVARRDFENARERLMATGMFESVGYSFEADETKKAYVATFKVAEVNPVFPVRCEDLGVPEAELLRVLAADPLFNAQKIPATKQVMDRYSAMLDAYLAEKAAAGVKPPKVGGEVTQLAPGQLAVVFRPAGLRPVVARVSFEGNKVVPQNVLQEAVWGVAVGTPFTENNFRVLLDASIRPVYEARGRVRVAFPKIEAETVKDVKGLKVTVTVDEGEVYTLGKVEIAGNPPISPESLLKTADVKKGDVANFDKVNEGVEKVRKAVVGAGYLNAKASSSRAIDEAKKTVDVTVTVEAGEQYKMGRLDVKGLDLTAEAEIRKIWTLKEGSAFQPDYPDYFLKRVKDLFDNLGATKTDTHRNEKDRTVDVTLTFSGVDPSQTIQNRRGGRGGGIRP